ncbi:MAG: sugar phosphate isomerase/epimerase [Negativicutes bacterium]|nr:sugar phosphate isomerase/epimerase [Negativicutes bacterium]
MRYGCCGSMNAVDPDGTGIEIADQLQEMGYDYVELSLAHLTSCSDQDFATVKKRLLASGLRCEACNNFFPATIRLTGDEINPAAINGYVEKALQRAGSLGVKVVVFGSGSAKTVPAGFPMRSAWQQLVSLLRDIDAVAGQNGITITIEPLRQAECNIVNTVREGLTLAKEVNRPNIKLLADFYHMTEQREDPVILLEAQEYIRHIHFANPTGRTFPRNATEANYLPFFAYLQQINYQARVSIEAYTKDFAADAVAALQLMQKIGN